MSEAVAASAPNELQPLSPRQVCERLNVSRRALARMVAAGSFPEPVRINHKVIWWPVSDVTAYLQARIEARDNAAK